MNKKQRANLNRKKVQTNIGISRKMQMTLCVLVVGKTDSFYGDLQIIKWLLNAFTIIDLTYYKQEPTN